MDRLLMMLFSTEVGEDNCPGGYVESPNWSYVAPGSRESSTLCPKYLNLRGSEHREEAPGTLDPRE
jgi:hypothetical protein